MAKEVHAIQRIFKVLNANSALKKQSGGFYELIMN